MKRGVSQRPASVYSRGFMAGAGDYMPTERAKSRSGNKGGGVSKVVIKRRRPEPLLFEELFSK